METPVIFWGVLGWMIVWGVVGSFITRRVYLRRDLDTSNTNFVGSMLGAATGPLGLVPLWAKTPVLTNRLMVFSTLGTVALLAAAFAFADPSNNCVSNGSFVASQITNGIIIGIIYGFMALGLTLIFSILGVVSFSPWRVLHGGRNGPVLRHRRLVSRHQSAARGIGRLLRCFRAGRDIRADMFLTPMYDGKDRTSG